MPRYKHYDLNQTKMIPLSYADPVVEGSFERALDEIVEEHFDLSAFEHCHRNDETGRSDYDSKVLRKREDRTVVRKCGAFTPWGLEVLPNDRALEWLRFSGHLGRGLSFRL